MSANAGGNRFLTIFVGIVMALLPTVIGAAPPDVGPGLTLTPTTAAPGGHVQVGAVGLTPNSTLCLGVLGPGLNAALGVAPAFRINLGRIAIGAEGSGAADVTVPEDLVAGGYQVIVGGCAPRQAVPPLATLAAATLIVNAPPTAPTRLPVSGGASQVVILVLAVLGLSTLLAGFEARVRRTHRGDNMGRRCPD